MTEKLEKKHIQLFIMCFVAYMLAYFGRVNLSVALPSMEQSGIFDISLLGYIGTAFFWIYAVGQLINGKSGDKIRLDLFIFWGLLISGLCNLLFGFTSITFLLIALWALNGLFQSMLWGPFMRIISRTFPESKRKNAGLIMFLACILGYLLAYVGLSNLMAVTSFRYAFILPGLLLMLYSFFWLFSNRKLDIVRHMEKSDTSYTALLKQKSVFLLVLLCIPLGFFREGVLLFGPLYLVKNFSLPFTQIMNQAILIPILNLSGVLIAKYVSDRIKNIYLVIGSLFTVGMISFIAIFVTAGISITLSVICISFCSACFYGTTSLVTSTIPLRHKLTSSLSGLLDFFIYFGAGLTGFFFLFIS
ncbi:MAG: MFS transporter [Clostridia bacterium]|nr:MFS transporter [Clostridia bacterium]